MDRNSYKYSQLKAQGFKCAICEMSIDLHHAHLDHNHTTDKLRGVLCASCNTLVGIAEAGIPNYILEYINSWNK